MTTALWVVIIAAFAPTLLALSALIASLRNGNKIHDVHLSLNSRLGELITASKALGAQEERDREASKAQGRIDEQRDQAANK